MQKLNLIIITSIIALFTAIAAPKAKADTLAPNVIAQSSFGGGLMRGFNKLLILSNGRVVSQSQRLDGPVETKEIARLSAFAVSNLKRKIADLPKSELKDTDPSQPKCNDSGVGTYSVNNKFGNVEVSISMECHSYVREDGLGEDIRTLIDALASLEY